MSHTRSFVEAVLISLSLFALLACATGSSAQARSNYVVDQAFGRDGLVTEGVGPISGSRDISPKALAKDAQGRILFGAANGAEWQISRFLPDGSPDISFGDQGKVVVSSWVGYGGPTTIATLGSGAVRPNGRILLAGFMGSFVLGNNARRGQATLVLTQLLSDGSPDLTFGQEDGGRLLEGGSGATKLVLRPDGGFLVGGFQQRYDTGRTDDGALFAFNSDGTLDDHFDQGPLYSTVDIFGAPGKPSDVFDVDLLPGGRILLSGTRKNRLWLMRLRQNGAPDRSFGKNGQVTMLPGGKKRTLAAVPRDLEVDNKGRLLVTGFTSPKDFENDTGYGLVMRFRKNGRLDKSFGSNGIVRLYGTAKRGERTTRLYDIQTDTKGGIWVIGSAGQSPRNKRRAITVRYLRNGKKDPRFFKKGVLNTGLGDGSVGTALIRAGKKMYLSGRYDQGSTEGFFIKRFTPTR
jgi:uncharacterized delta-60 repeat protein